MSSPAQPAPPAESLDRMLVEAKLRIPTRDGAVPREGLIESARASGRRVVAISAPAGYGKTTLLAEWARSEQRRVACISLDRFDDDPARVVGLLSHACRTISPSSAESVTRLVGPGPSSLARIAPQLAAAFSASPEPFVLMVDDLHELRRPECHDVLGLVVDGTPPGSQFVAASRSAQPFVPRLRAAGDAIELGAADLAFDADGTRQALTAAGVTPTDALVSRVVERAEGWPVGVHLAALIARDGGDDTQPLSGSDPYVADYLYRESLERQTADVQRFLVRSAVLDEMCGSLCDAVVGTREGAQTLRHLEAAGLFTIPLDRRREWYRYHGLFREFLLGELERQEPAALDGLHVHAADWYEANGLPARAIEHLVLTTDRDRTLRAVDRVIVTTYYTGGLSTGLRWLETLGDESIEQYPPLAAWAGWSGILTGVPATAERWGAFVDAVEFDEKPADGTDSFASCRAMFKAALCAAGPEQMLADAEFAVAREPSWSPYSDTALWALAEAQVLIGSPDEARATFTESDDIARSRNNFARIVTCHGELALLAIERGDWPEAAAHVQRACSTIKDVGLDDYAISGLAYAAAARVALHDGDLEATKAELTRAMRVRPSLSRAFPFIAVRVRLWLARVYRALADHAAARQLLREIDDILHHRPALGTLVPAVEELKRELASDPAAGGTTPLTPAELRVLPYLQTHLTLAAIAERLIVSRNTVSTQVSAIYRKLGVGSRREAVERATTIGLLGD